MPDPAQREVTPAAEEAISPRPAGRRTLELRVGLQGPRSTIWGILVLVLVTVCFADFANSNNLYLFNTALLACFGAIALNLIMGTAGQVSVGNASFLAVGGFASVIALNAGIAFPLDVIIGGVLSAIVGAVVGLPALRLRGLYLALSTLAALYIVLYVAQKYQVSSPKGGPLGFTLPQLYSSYGLLGEQRAWAWTLLGCMIVLTIFAVWMTRGRIGRAWRIIRDHEDIASAMGIATTRYKLGAFALSSAIIGLEGGLQAHFTGGVSVDNYTLTLSIQFVAMVLIGGLDSVGGAIVGAALVTALPTIVTNVLHDIVGQSGTFASDSSQVSLIVYGVLIVLFVTRSPDGLAGWLRRIVSIMTGKLGARRASADAARAESESLTTPASIP